MADHGTARKRVDTTGDVLNDLRAELRQLLTEADRAASVVTIDPENGIDMREEVAKYQRDLIVKALSLARGKQKEAARLLHLSPSSLHVKMRSLGIDPKDL